MANIIDFENIIEEPVKVTFHGQEITIKKHISESEKIALAYKIKKFYFTEDGVESDNGEFACKDLLNAVYIVSIIANYTDIDIGDTNNYIAVSDIVTSSGLFDKVISSIPINERIMFKEMIDKAISEEHNKKQVEMPIENQIKNLLSKIPNEDTIKKLLKDTIDKFNSFDPSKLKFLNEKAKEFGENPIPTAEDMKAFTDNIINLTEKKS